MGIRPLSNVSAGTRMMILCLPKVVLHLVCLFFVVVLLALRFLFACNGDHCGFADFVNKVEIKKKKRHINGIIKSQYKH